jgi:hypothetical protein
MERPNSDDSALPPDPTADSDPVPKPHFPKPAHTNKKTVATPLDPAEHIKDGIEVNET